MSTLPPTRIGTDIPVASSAKLAELDSKFLTLGTSVFNLETSTYWVLTLSNASPGPGAIAVSGVTGSRWIEATGPAPGVTSIISGDGISVDQATGAVTVTNTGVISVAPGSGISVSTTGGVA